MKYEELLNLVEENENIRYNIENFSEKDGICVVNNLISLPVVVSSSYHGDVDRGVYDINICDESDQKIGILCLCTQLGEINVNSITDAQYAAYINEVSLEQFNLPFKFSKDYVVLNLQDYDNYTNKYLEFSSVWGGFVHQTKNDLIPQPYRYFPESITAISGLKFPTLHHQNACMISVMEPYGFERFLRLYHLFELLFDWDVVQQIRNLGEDLVGIGQLLAQVERNELDRLKDIMRSRCTDINRITECLNCINSEPEYLDIGKAIFFKYAKSGNPFGDETAFDNLMSMGGFSFENARQCGIGNIRKDHNLYDRLVINCSAYFIYRIRSSIAHSRISEYIMTSKDEKFVVNFAEPLLRELLCQAFK